MFYMEDKIIDIRKKFQNNQIKFSFNDGQFIFFYQKFKKDTGNVNFDVKIKQSNGQYISAELFLGNNKYEVNEIEKPVFNSIIAFG